MTAMSQILDLITWLTIGQLLVLTWVLLRSAGRRQLSHLFLAGFFLVNVLLMAFFYALRHAVFPISPYGFFAVWSSFFLLAPLLYIYVAVKCSGEFYWRPAMAVHCLPMLTAFAAGSIGYAWRAGQAGGPVPWMGRMGVLLTAALHLLIAAYLVAVFLRLFRRHGALKQRYSNLAEVDLAWLTVLIAVFVVHWMFDVANFLLGFVEGTSVAVHQLMDIFAIGILGLFALVTVLKSLKHPDLADPPGKGTNGSRSSDSGAFESTRRRLEAWMTGHRPYLNPELSLDLLANELGVSAKHLSQCINGRFHQNFFDYVNSYRVAEAKKLLRDRPQDTISEIMFEAGFNSKATFNRIFKKQTAMTPTQYRGEQDQQAKASMPSKAGEPV